MTTTWGSPYEANSAEDIQRIYDAGFKGVQPADPITRAYYRGRTPTFYSAYPEARGIANTLETCLPIRACQAMLGQDFCAVAEESQRQGDCVGKMVRNQGMIDGCMDAMWGETEWLYDDDGQAVQYCCEPIYGERGHGGEGADCQRLWNAVGPDGGVGFLHRDVYEVDGETYDLSRYRADLSGRWGGRGTPDPLAKLAAANPALRIYRPESLQELMDALALGFGAGRCGSQGFSNKRGKDGVSGVTTTWYHAIAIGGFVRPQRIIDKYGGPLWLYYHNWGTWNSGEKAYEQPEGSWFVETKHVEARIRSGSVAIVGSVVGKNRKLIWDRMNDRRSDMIREGYFSECITV